MFHHFSHTILNPSLSSVDSHSTYTTRRHNELYYARATPEISDADYDGIFQYLLLHAASLLSAIPCYLLLAVRPDMPIRQAVAVEKEHPAWVAKDTPTRKVGEVTTPGFRQVDAFITPFISLVLPLVPYSLLVFLSSL
jgi:hypothetical protein